MMKGMEKRVDIKLGFACNNNYRFCAVASKRKLCDRATEDVKRELAFAKDLGFKKIEMQTNGRMLFYKDFCEKIINSGANEFFVSIHGHTPGLQDFLTRSPGSWKQTVQGIKNLKCFGQFIATNTVVVKPNCRHLPEIAKHLVELGADKIQFSFVHPIGNAGKFDSVVPRVSMAAPYIHRGIQIAADAGLDVVSEAMPFCLMKGYEKYLSETRETSIEVREPAGIIRSFEGARKNECKSKFPQCTGCKYDGACEGIWKEYPENFGASEFVTVNESVNE